MNFKSLLQRTDTGKQDTPNSLSTPNTQKSQTTGMSTNTNVSSLTSQGLTENFAKKVMWIANLFHAQAVRVK